MRNRLFLAAAAAFLAAPSGPASAETRFYGQMDLYSLAAPDGWTPYTDRGYADVAYDAPGGKSQGGIFAGLKDAARGLSDEVSAFIGADPVEDRRAVTIDGVPCETATTVKDGYVRNAMVLCHIIVPFADGDATVEFFLGSAAPVAQAEWQNQVFWQVANSIQWGDEFEPAP